MSENVLETTHYSNDPHLMAQASDMDGSLIVPDERKGVPNLSACGYDCIRYMSSCVNGYVYLGKNRKSKQHVAVKKYFADDPYEYELIAKEASNMRLMSHENILKIETCFVYDNSIYMITPAMNLGSMYDIIMNHWKFGITEKAALCVVKQLIAAVVYIHQKRFIHRDIRSQHILVDSNGIVKLTGFRYMIELNHHLDCVFDFDGHLRNQIYYFAPEVLAQNMHGYGTKSDIFMIGIVLCEMLNGIVPFDEISPLEMLYRKLNKQVPRPVDAISLRGDAQKGIDISSRPEQHRTRTFSEDLHTFVENCLIYEADDRPSAKQLMDSSWLKKSSGVDLMKEFGFEPQTFELSQWQQEPLLPVGEPQKYDVVFDYSRLDD